MQRRDEQLNLRVSAELVSAIEHAAARKGLRATEWARIALREAAERDAGTPATPPRKRGAK